MILWLTGNTEAGKTTLAKKLASKNTIILDGDELRTVWTDLGLGEEDRRDNNIRAANLARVLESQGFSIIVAMICPYADLRDQVREICNCKFLYLPGGKEGPEFPYEVPIDAEIATVGWKFRGKNVLIGQGLKVVENA